MSRTLSRQLYILFHYLSERINTDEIRQERATIMISNNKNLCFLWRYKQHMKQDPSKLVIEWRLWEFKIIDRYRSRQKTFFCDSVIPNEDPITDDEEAEPCCRECIRNNQFFVCWVIYPLPQLKVFCEHRMEIIDNFINY